MNNEYTMERFLKSIGGLRDSIPFDKEMIPIVTELNEKGYKTFACCQGHIREDLNCRGWNGYIGFCDKYEFDKEPPLFRVGMKYHNLVDGYSEIKKGRIYYWYGSKSKKMNCAEREKERQQWINSMIEWSKGLKSIKNN